ncbi:unnamed protein product [Prorocentrum cordatum]|uniref:Uncharacterized protein n=1 Tax=Prorocentrum cordatum TaxID=2364126 RepID=A0ABN9WNU0_9DINO|nr:unnamed protein product [Polarella glacialis]
MARRRPGRGWAGPGAAGLPAGGAVAAEDAAEGDPGAGCREGLVREIYQRMCHCKSGGAELQTSIETAQARLPQLRNTLDELKHAKAQQDADIKKHKADNAAAKEALDKAHALRNKEAKASASAISELRVNIEAVGKALDALKNGMEESFLQTGAADILRRLIVDADMRSADRDKVAAFVSVGDAGSAANSGRYEPKSGDIIGILTTMADAMQEDLAKAIAIEDQSIRGHGSLVEAKEKEVKALTKATEDLLESSGLLGVESWTWLATSTAPRRRMPRIRNTPPSWQRAVPRSRRNGTPGLGCATRSCSR